MAIRRFKQRKGERMGKIRQKINIMDVLKSHMKLVFQVN